MKALNWNTNEREAAEMRKYQAQSLGLCESNSAENWMKDMLAATGLNWTRQAIWGRRLFDFWNGEKGIAVEVDGGYHKAQRQYDRYRDEYNFRRSGVLVLRVENFDSGGAERAIRIIAAESTHRERKVKLGIHNRGHDARRVLSALPYPPSLLEQYLAKNYGTDTVTG